MAGKKRFLTLYSVGEHEYGGDVWANNLRHAERICKRRNIGEKVIGFGRKTGGLPKAKTRHQKLHEAAYLGWIALEMGLLTPKDVLGDKGIVHEMIHRLSGAKVPGLEARFRALQRMIPGHYP